MKVGCFLFDNKCYLFCVAAIIFFAAGCAASIAFWELSFLGITADGTAESSLGFPVGGVGAPDGAVGTLPVGVAVAG